MNGKQRFASLIFMVCLVLASSREMSFGVERSDSAEDLLFMEIPSITAASRKEQLVTEAPASVEVLTSEDIKNCGATSIPEAMRMLTGINLATTNSRNSFVNIRGFHEAVANSILAMIDGRPVTWDVYNEILWQQQSIGLDEIERIEVVKGPGSSLYGANAYTGIVNIITKTPEQIGGTYVNYYGGTPRLSNTSIIHGKATDKVAYKVSVGLDTQDEWKDTAAKDAGQVSRGNAFAEYKLTDDSKISLSAGRSYALNDKFSGGESLGIGYNLTGDINDYVQVAYNLGGLSLRSYLRNSDMNVKFPASSSAWGFKTMNSETELQHSVDIHEKHSLVWGGSFRVLSLKKNEVTSDDYSQNMFGVFAEDQFKATDKLKIILGGRYDNHPLVEARVSPRAGILYTVKKGHIIMLSATRAFRNPTLLNSYINYSYLAPGSGGLTTISALGNKDLKPEDVTSYQAEYRYNLSKKANGKLGVFYNTYSNFINTGTNYVYYLPNALYPGSPAFPMQVTSSFVNAGKAENTGAEFSMNILLAEWLSGMFNYSFAQTTNREDDPNTASVNEKDSIRKDEPKNRVNLSLNAKFRNDVSAYLGAQWVDSMVYDYLSSPTDTLIQIDGYTVVNARIGYVFMKNRAEVSLSAFNLFDKKFYEGAPGDSLVPLGQYALAEEIGRRITAKVSYKF